jgi:hypothetical protein
MIEHVPIHPYWSCAMSLSPTDPDNLRLANPDDVAEAMSHALRYDGGRRRVHHADSIMARATVRPLLAGGYVIMKKGGAVAPPRHVEHADRAQTLITASLYGR